MDREHPIFVELRSTDAQLAAEVADRLGVVLPPACIAGVAANARLLQWHVDVLRGLPR
ncbi:hypothetical protein [Sphingobium boeckii]|uniref:Uncharacterized protein n=1 Tax=Sphingobium boeckii TaxID=1082345 RepID=A0A7W9AHC0_9SPHN|nr:hypothetical protein [Sphingobium boeckii]MBB5685703.1 hypothetical protein [Sphingobium boeckii]